MQFAGQIVGHRPHATHLGRPSACTAMRCVPRQRADFLRQTLAGLVAQQFPREQFEVLVIDSIERPTED